MEDILAKYNIKLVDGSNITKDPIALGIGDLLFIVNLIKYGKLKGPLYINLLTVAKYFPNAANALEFRIRLLDYACKYNEVDFNNFKFTKYNNLRVNPHFELVKQLSNLKLNLFLESAILPEQLAEKDYIIFHTKCRFTHNFNYKLLKQQLTTFCSKFKSKYNIVLLGERTFPGGTPEGDYLKTTTVYSEFKLLENNNHIIDLTKQSIYNELSFENYMVDMKIISNAKFNICVGCGGQFCNTIFFGNKTYTVWANGMSRLGTNVPEVSYFYNINEYFDVLQKVIGK